MNKNNKCNYRYFNNNIPYKILKILAVFLLILFVGSIIIVSAITIVNPNITISTPDNATPDTATFDTIAETTENLKTITTTYNCDFEKQFEIVTTYPINKSTEPTTMESIEVQPITEIPPTTTAQIETTQIETEPIEISVTQNDVFYSASDFQMIGVIYWYNWRWTYYSERILPGNGLDIPSRHNDENGYVCDGDNYICLASSSLSKGTIIDTPLGKQGKIYDSGCASDVIDVYVAW